MDLEVYSVSFFCTLNTRKIRRGGRGTDRQNSDTSKSGGRSQSLLMVSHHRRTVDLQSQTKVSCWACVQSLKDLLLTLVLRRASRSGWRRRLPYHQIIFSRYSQHFFIHHRRTPLAFHSNNGPRNKKRSIPCTYTSLVHTSCHPSISVEGVYEPLISVSYFLVDRDRSNRATPSNPESFSWTPWWELSYVEMHMALSWPLLLSASAYPKLVIIFEPLSQVI
jgi:hypothetical protein